MKKSTSILRFSQNTIDAVVIKGGKSFLASNICFQNSLVSKLNSPNFLENELVLSDDVVPVKTNICGGQLFKP